MRAADHMEQWRNGESNNPWIWEAVGPSSELVGPLSIGQTLTLDAQGGVLYAAQGPTLEILTDADVTLRNVHLSAATGIAVTSRPTAKNLTLENVVIRGAVDEALAQRTWSWPLMVDLSATAGEKTPVLAIRAPEPCMVEWTMATLGSGSEAHPAGQFQKSFPIPPQAEPGQCLCGLITIKTGSGKILGNILTGGWVRPSQPSTPPPDPPPKPRHHRWVWLCAAVILVATPLWMASRAMALRAWVQPQAMDYGTLFYGKSGTLAATNWLTLAKPLGSHFAIIRLRVETYFDGQAVPPYSVEVEMSEYKVRIAVPISIVNLYSDSTHYLTGLVHVASSATNWQITPVSIPFQARLDPATNSP